MKSETRNVLQNTQGVIEQINDILKSNYAISQMGSVWYINTGDGFCMNGHWTEATLQRMYDQTAGYLKAVISIQRVSHDHT